MDLLNKLDREETRLTKAIMDKLVIGYYEHSLADLRDLITAAAVEIRRQSEVNRKLGDALSNKAA